MRSLSILLVLLYACEEPLVSHYGSCYSGPSGTSGVGQCRPGTTETSSIGVSCVGDILPSDEICDGIDNDCNGEVDDRIGGVGESCGLGICRGGRTVCNGEEIVCSTDYKKQPEECDGSDNDCNGLVDDGIARDWCFDAEFWKATHPPCKIGLSYCDYGKWICEGQVLPFAERCDQIDNDCNGVVDDVPNTGDVVKIDIVVIIDRSCSMGTRVSVVGDSLADYWNRQTQDDSTDVAMFPIDMPGGNTTSTASPNRECYSLGMTFPVGPCPDPNNLASMTRTFGSSELSYDIISDAAKGRFVHWRPGANRFIFLFADEHGQSARGLTEQDVANELKARGITFYGFVELQAFFDDIANETDGRLFPIHTNQIPVFISEILWPGC